VSVYPKFVDIHCHMLPGLDDGAVNLGVSLAMAEMAVADGIATVVATPHQLGNYARNRGDTIRAYVARFQRELDARRIPLRVLPGADVRIEPDMVERLVGGDVVSLADLRRHVLLELPHELYVPLEGLLALGRANATDAREPFNMAYLAVRGAGAVNGVSRLHGRVSQGILQPLFPRWPRREVPVGHITNGVHVPSWDSAAADALWTRACGKARWRGALGSVDSDLRQVSDKDLWDLRSEGRHQLVQYLRERLVRQHRGRGAGTGWLRECADVLAPDVLTLGFARRFTEYKRTNLLLHEPQRLLRLLFDPDRPVQLVISGKAHPQDFIGKELLRQWQVFVEQAHGRVVFVEDYDLGVAEQLVQGVDLWLNTPRRPWEASGTSGMKVLVNGGVNFSELDGWWAEAFRPEVGWALGDGREHADTAATDAAEAQAMYRLLEDDVVPSFYQRDRTGLPRAWLARVRESMARLTPEYSTNRMLREYVETYYVPLADGFQRRSTDAANALEQWCQLIEHHWERLHFGNVTSQQSDGAHRFEVQVYLAELPPEAIAVQLYAEPLDDGGPLCLPLQRDGLLMGSENAYVFRGEVPADRPASDYTPRIIPFHEQASVPLEAPFILWLR